MNRKQLSGNQRRPSRPNDQELRTPMAWQHRDINYQQQHHIYAERFGMVPEVGQMPSHYQYQTGPGSEELSSVRGATRTRYRSSNHRPQSPSTDTSTTTSTEEHDNEAGNLVHQDTRHDMPPPQAMGTLRSIQSTVTTWDGEPCPVHHLAMPMPMPMPMPMQPILLQPPPPPHYPMLAVPPPPPPAVLLPPMLRPRPLVMPADAQAPPEPLPVRDPVSPLPPKDVNSIKKDNSFQCCKGHIIVLWIILCIILTGILLGIVLRFVFA